MDKISKKRSARSTNKQIEIMIDFIDENKIMLKNTTSTENKEVEAKWKELTELLETQKGAQKTTAQWKRTFIEFKSKTRGKARDLRSQTLRTGGGTNPVKDLTDMEEKLMNLVGWVCVEGDPQLAEAGLSQKQVAPINLEEE